MDKRKTKKKLGIKEKSNKKMKQDIVHKDSEADLSQKKITYTELASPGKWIILLQFLSYAIHYVIKPIGAIFTARIIVGVYDGLATGDFSYAY